MKRYQVSPAPGQEIKDTRTEWEKAFDNMLDTRGDWTHGEND